MNKTNMEKIIDQMTRIMADIGITDDSCARENFIWFDACLEGKEYILRVHIGVDEEDSSIIMYIHPSFDIPEEMASLVMEMVNRINKCATIDYVVYRPDLDKVAVETGLMLTENGELDEAEFEKSIRTLLGNAGFYLDLTMERLSSKEKTEDIFDRMYRDFPGNRC